MERTQGLALGYQPPLAWPALATFLAQRGAACLEQFDGRCYRRTLARDGQWGWISVLPAENESALQVTVSPGLRGAASWLRSALRRLFDLDADTPAIAAHLRRDHRLATHVDRTPGLRIPGTLDGFELALRAVLGQQITVKAATTVFTRFARYFGEPVDTPFDGLDRLAPRAEALADAGLQQIIDRGLPRKRAETIRGLAQAVASGALRLDASAPAAQTRAALQALPGIGPWTAHYIGMRALADPDAFPERDIGLIRALGIADPRELQAAAEPWRPWRAYAAMYLWHHRACGG
ncbi:MAG: DNA-3-methyladenine glycosylase [Salinisphaera sp.]|nr:DNA-3-methyladenine glycosylase [Salinisphaera sp.]